LPRKKKEYYIALISISPYYEKILFNKKYTFEEFVDAGQELLKLPEYSTFHTFKVYHESELPE
jgi:hypothetical protein